MYDGEHQIQKFNEMIEESKVPKDFVILRDRWYDSKKDYVLPNNIIRKIRYIQLLQRRIVIKELLNFTTKYINL